MHVNTESYNTIILPLQNTQEEEIQLLSWTDLLQNNTVIICNKICAILNVRFMIKQTRWRRSRRGTVMTRAECQWQTACQPLAEVTSDSSGKQLLVYRHCTRAEEGISHLKEVSNSLTIYTLRVIPEFPNAVLKSQMPVSLSICLT